MENKLLANNLDAYKMFYVVAKKGSITAAADQLAISQPAVSQAIKQLEDTLDTKLFARIAKGVRLTKEGEVLFSYISKGYEYFVNGEQKLMQMKNMEIGEIKIGASDMTLQFFLLPYLEIFHDRYPEIKVSVTNGPTPETLSNLDSGKIDFGIVSTPFVSQDDIAIRPVREIEDTFVAGRRFIQYKNKMLDLTVLQDLPLILLEGNTSSRNYMNHFLESNRVTINPEFELATSEMIVQFALRSLGVGCVVRDFAKEYLDKGMLYELRFNKMIPKREFCVVTHKKSPLTTAAGKLLDIIFSDLA